MGLFDLPVSPSAISSLIEQMRATKAGINGPPPAPQNAAMGAPPPSPPMQVNPAIPQTPLLAPAPNGPTGPSIPVMDATAHDHQGGITGGLMHLLGADRLQPELGALLTPDQRERAKPGLASSLFGYLLAGQTPTQIEESRAKKMLGYQKDKVEQDISKRMQSLWQKYQPQPGETEDQAQERLRRYVMDVATTGGMPAQVIPNLMDALKAPVGKSYEPQLFVGPNGETAWVQPGLPVPAGYHKYAAPGSEGTAKWFKTPDGTIKAFKPTEQPPKGSMDLETGRTIITTTAANDRQQNTLTSKRVTDFQRSIKPQTDRAPIIEQALVTLKDAADTTDPAKQRTLYSSAIANFVQAADQKAQLRYQLLNFFKSNVDPSIGGKWEVLKQRLMDGRLPQYTLNAMISHLSNLKKMTGDEINRQRAAWVTRHPSLDGELPDANEFFAGGFDGGAPDAPSGKTMSRATFNQLSPSEQKSALAAGYVVK